MGRLGSGHRRFASLAGRVKGVRKNNIAFLKRSNPRVRSPASLRYSGSYPLPTAKNKPVVLSRDFGSNGVNAADYLLYL